MTDNTPESLAEQLRTWLEEGNLKDQKSIPETIDIAQMKRKAAQRIMAARRAQSDDDPEDETS